MTATYWSPHGWTGHESVDGIEVVVDATGTISSVAARPTPTRGAIHLEGVMVPGLVNAHSHAFHRALRARTHEQGDFWAWRELMYRIADALQPDTYEALATAVFGEMALAGVTTVGEFHYLHHDRQGARYDDRNAMSHAVVRAARSAGLRLVLLDTCYLTADVDGAALEGPQLRFSDGSADAWHERHELLAGDYAAVAEVTVGAAVHSVRAVPQQAMSTVAAGAGTGPLHVHLSEQLRENQRCIEVLGRTPTQVLADGGALGPMTTGVHAIHVGAGDRALLATSGSMVCLCPTTERDLGDGWAPAAEFAADGIRWALGSDSHASIDLFEEARAVELNDRARLRRRGIHDPVALLAAATTVGVQSLGIEGGRLAAGQPADFVVIRPDTVRMAGNLSVSSVVFAATAGDVAHVFVAGRHIVDGGRHQLIESVPRLLTSAIHAIGIDS